MGQLQHTGNGGVPARGRRHGMARGNDYKGSAVGAPGLFPTPIGALSGLLQIVQRNLTAIMVLSQFIRPKSFATRPIPAIPPLRG